MDCKTASSKIQPFLSDDLSSGELKEFIRHVSSCENCRKDTEFMLMLRTAEEAVREKNRTDFDFSHLLDDKIALIRKNMRKKRAFLLILVGLASLLFLFFALIFVIYIGR